MIAKEKAQELFDKYNLSFAGVISNEEDWEYLAKQCALIAVDEVINSMTVATSVHLPYWQQVKHELNNNKNNETKQRR
jgi:hypothetical protein